MLKDLLREQQNPCIDDSLVWDEADEWDETPTSRPHDPLVGQYLIEIGQMPLLSSDEEQTLAAQVAHGDQQARTRFLEANLRLVVHVAKSYQGLGLDFADLIQEGNLGLLRALDKFDPSCGRFSTYAVYWIRQRISRAIVQKGRAIRLPDHFHAQLRRFERVTMELTEQLGDLPDRHTLARALSTTPEHIAFLQQARREVCSLDQTLSSHDDLTLGDTIADTMTPWLDEAALAHLQHSTLPAQVQQLLTCLTERERAAIILRFGLDGAGEHTLGEIGHVMGICRERVRQLVERALERLREQTVSCDLSWTESLLCVTESNNIEPTRRVTRAVS